MHLELVAEIPEIAGKLSARGLVHSFPVFLICCIESAFVIRVLLTLQQHVLELDRIHVRVRLDFRQVVVHGVILLARLLMTLVLKR